MPLSWLPQLVGVCEPLSLQWAGCEDILYNHFLNDFVSNAPTSAGGKPIRVHQSPETNGRHRTFWHLISRGLGPEALRNIRKERCERIRWPRAIIQNAASGDVAKWRSTHDGKERILLAIEEFSYIVVLESERTALTLVTAYDVDKRRRRKSLAREHADYHAGKGPIQPPQK